MRAEEMIGKRFRMECNCKILGRNDTVKRTRQDVEFEEWKIRRLCWKIRDRVEEATE